MCNPSERNPSAHDLCQGVTRLGLGGLFLGMPRAGIHLEKEQTQSDKTPSRKMKNMPTTCDVTLKSVILALSFRHEGCL